MTEIGHRCRKKQVKSKHFQQFLPRISTAVYGKWCQCNQQRYLQIVGRTDAECWDRTWRSQNRNSVQQKIIRQNQSINLSFLAFRSGIDLILLLILLFLLGRPSSRKPKAPSFQIGSGWNLAGRSFTCVGWKVTLCDPIWQVKPRSSEMTCSGELYRCLLYTSPSPRD